MLTSQLALQVSAAHLHAAEAEFPPQPRSNVERLTASATYHRLDSGGNIWATTLAYGVNSSRDVIPGDIVDLTTHAVLLESNLTVRETHAWWGRIEAVGKPGHDLHVHEDPVRVFTVGKIQAGYARYLRPWKGLAPGIGVTVSASLVPEALASRYSGRLAPGIGLFLTLRPSRHVM